VLELAVVVPTFKEVANVRPLLERLETALHGISYEVIFVDDDSPDGTAENIRCIAAGNPRIHVLQRIERRGLASACVEGMMATAAPYIAVMDADLQHDEKILPEMLAKIKREKLDLVVATRNAVGGSMGDFSASRVQLSNLGRKLSAAISHCDLSDPMSGYFLLDRSFLEEVVHRVSGIGFKILLDLVASATRPVRMGEVPYRFGQRLHGESKLDILVGIEYVQLLLDKLIGDVIPARYVIFGMVGTVGVVIYLSILSGLLRAHQSFVAAQVWATVAVMTLNFFLNNAITYRDRRLKGAGLLAGLLSFYVACSIGAFVNVRVASFGVQNGAPWYIAGLVGIGIGSVWNYGVTAAFTWRRRRRSGRPAEQRARVARSELFS
jgi:dolichol-phosphate mannosyltransferase